MELTAQLYLALLVLIAVGRLLELAHSRRNQQRLVAAGSSKTHDPGYKWMIALHTGLLLGCALEVGMASRPWIPLFGGPMLVLFFAANALRWWVICTLGSRWNVEVMSASRMGVVTEVGPYRWMRHPNYTAVFVEMLALPLIHSAWITAIVGTALHTIVLRHRIALEESVMRQDPTWQAAFATRPRFVPRVSSERFL
jgi:methyltransferase